MYIDIKVQLKKCKNVQKYKGTSKQMTKVQMYIGTRVKMYKGLKNINEEFYTFEDIKIL